jgi:hypothetical protein
MTNKLSGRYYVETYWSGINPLSFSFYCIPVELKNKFEKMKEDINPVIWDSPQKEFLQKIELFNSIFINYRLDKPLNKYSFTDLQEIEE